MGRSFAGGGAAGRKFDPRDPRAEHEAMIIYEVNLVVDPEVAGDYAAWLGPHMGEVLACPGFLSAEWSTLDDEGDGKVRWCVQYRLADRAALEAYLAGPAAALRADAVDRFGGRFEATRRVMQVREARPAGGVGGGRPA